MIDTLHDAIKNRKVKEEDYPKVAIACEYGKQHAYGHSLKCHSSVKAPVGYVKPLLQELSKYGTPPSVKFDSNGKPVFVGTCAEDSAANQVMIKNHIASGHYPKLKNLVFTRPVRARNYQRLDFCDVCNAIF